MYKRPTVTVGNGFLGREEELAGLRGGLEETFSSQGRLFLLTGDRGIGKTRLADETSREAAQRGARVLWGRSWEGGGAPAYWPWVQVIRSCLLDEDADILALMGSGAPHIARMVPEVRERLPDLEAAPEAEPERARFLQFDATATFLANLSAAQPLMLVLDDLHAADVPSLLLLEFVSRDLRRIRALLICVYNELEARRDPQVRALLGRLAREGSTIRLEGLGRGEVARLMEVMGDQVPSEAQAAAIHGRTDGNPLFVSELARLLTSEPHLAEVAAGAEPLSAVPESVRQTIRRRLEILPKESIDMLSVAAVIGRDFDMSLLQQAVEMDASQLLDLLPAALESGILTELPGRISAYRFSHGLIRDLVYEDLPPRQRLELHLRIGRVLEERYEANPDPHLAELAHHFFLAAPSGVADEAVEYATRAAERAVSQFAHEEAVPRYRQALEALDLQRRPDETRRCELLIGLGGALNRAGDVDEARDVHVKAADVARSRGLAEHLARSALGYGRASMTTGAVDEPMVRLLEESLGALGERDSELRVDVMTRLSVELYYSDSAEAGDRRASLAREAVAVARRLEDPNALAYALEAAAWAEAGPDNLEQRLDAGAEVIRLSLGPGGRGLEGVPSGHLLRVAALLEHGDVASATTEIEAYARVAAELHDAAHVWYTRMLRATGALLAGRFEEGGRLAREALKIGERGRSQEASQYFAVQTFVRLRETGGHDETRELIPVLGDLADRFPVLPAFRAALGCAHLELGSKAAARTELKRLTARDPGELPRNMAWLAAMALLSELCVALEDPTASEPIYQAMLPYASHNVVFDFAIASLGSASRYLGLLASSLGRHEDATRHFEAAIDMNTRMGARSHLAHAQHELAEMLLDRGQEGDRDRASGLLSEALETARDIGMAGLEAKATAVLERLAGAPSGAGEAAEAPASTSGEFRREGEYWSVVYQADSFRLKDSKGLRYLAQLLSHPGDEFYALDLVASERGDVPARLTGRAAAEAGLQVSDLGDAGAQLDPQAKAAYKQRLDDLREEIEEAESWGDAERASRAREEIDFLARELASAVGLGGRDRKAASAAERARVNVTRAIRSALERIGASSSALAEHLDGTVRTGTFCSYRPDPRVPIVWKI